MISTVLRTGVLVAVVLSLAAGRPEPAPAAGKCGEVVTLETRDGARSSYSLAAGAARGDIALVLLAGGGGFVDLDEGGCARKLAGNSLVRGQALFHGLGFVTALLDAPTDHQAGDALGGFRIAPEHADDIGRVIADVRRRTGLPVWLVGTSRGTISAANAAARLAGPAAPDGIVLTSPITSGYEGGRKAWVAQTVFSVDLAAIRQPVLVVAHAEDKCIRTPPDRAGGIAGRVGSARKQSVLVAGGPGLAGEVSVEACRGTAPHGYAGQETEVAEGMARFIRGGTY